MTKAPDGRLPPLPVCCEHLAYSNTGISALRRAKLYAYLRGSRRSICSVVCRGLQGPPGTRILSGPDWHSSGTWVAGPIAEENGRAEEGGLTETISWARIARRQFVLICGVHKVGGRERKVGRCVAQM